MIPRMMKPLSDTIALEAMANPGALEATFRKLPQLVSYLTSTVTEALTGNRLSKAVLGFFAGNSALRFANRIQNAPYAPLRTLEVSVPQGLTTDLLSYGQDLQSAARACSGIEEDMLVPFSHWVGEKLGNPKALASVLHNTEVRGYRRIDTVKLSDALARHMATHGRREGTMPYGKAIKRNQDWYEINAIVESLRATLTDELQERIVDQTNELSTRLELLVANIKAAESEKPSGQNIAALAELTYQVASAVEFYGTLRYQVETYLEAIRNTIETVEAKL